MKIVGLQKLTLLDYPSKTACTVFTGGCNLRCPFCHNSDLVLHHNQTDEIDESTIIDLLKKRKGLLDGICITGGEPMLMKDLPNFLFKLRKLDISIKIDTNGFFPSQLKYIVNSGLCDYIAMDIKNTPEKYAMTVGLNEVDISKPKESIDFLRNCGIDHEFRTTVCKPFHTENDIVKIAMMLGSKEKYFLQSFIDSGKLIGEGISGFSPNEMKEMLKKVQRYVPLAQLRGV